MIRQSSRFVRQRSGQYLSRAGHFFSCSRTYFHKSTQEIITGGTVGPSRWTAEESHNLYPGSAAPAVEPVSLKSEAIAPALTQQSPIQQHDYGIGFQEEPRGGEKWGDV